MWAGNVMIIKIDRMHTCIQFNDIITKGSHGIIVRYSRKLLGKTRPLFTFINRFERISSDRKPSIFFALGEIYPPIMYPVRLLFLKPAVLVTLAKLRPALRPIPNCAFNNAGESNNRIIKSFRMD